MYIINIFIFIYISIYTQKSLDAKRSISILLYCKKPHLGVPLWPQMKSNTKGSLEQNNFFPGESICFDALHIITGSTPATATVK